MDNSSWVKHYQNACFEKDSNKSISSRRKCVELGYYYSNKSASNDVTKLLLEDNLMAYSEAVDDESGISNFSSEAIELMRGVTSDSKSWRCMSSATSIISSLPDLKSNNSGQVNVCSSNIPSNNELKKFFSGNLQSQVPKPPTFSKPQNSSVPSSTTTNSWKSDFHCVNTQLVNIKAKESESEAGKKTNDRKRLYSNYKINEDIDDGPAGISSIYTKRLGGRVKQRGFNDDENEIPDLSQTSAKSSGNSRKKLYSLYNDNDNEDEGNAASSSIYTKWLGGKSKQRQENPNSFRKEFDNLELDSKAVSTDLFMTAGELKAKENEKKFGNRNENSSLQARYHPNGEKIQKSLGGKRRVGNKFVPPMNKNIESKNSNSTVNSSSVNTNDEIYERLKNVDPKMIDLIRSEIMDTGTHLTWDDIAGLEFAKTTIQEIVVWPMLRPDIFTGLRRPPKGILLFGPPGTGKTLIGKCIASESQSTFFSISASSLTSKWIGDGEKMVRALFAVARDLQPAVVFIDEIDSLLSQRSETEHESSRRIKTEFLVQLDGAATGEEDRILVIGATNRPQELDEAARRRLTKRLYIPLPDQKARIELLNRLMKSEKVSITEEEFIQLAELTEGYSGADVKCLCQEACLGPIRSLSSHMISKIRPEELRPIAYSDFISALNRVRSSVSSKDLEIYTKWDQTYGSGTVS